MLRRANDMERRRSRVVAGLCALSLVTGAVVTATTAGADSGSGNSLPPLPLGKAVTKVEDCPGVPTEDYDARADGYSIYDQIKAMGAESYYKAGYFGRENKTGPAVDIAVIDSGIAPVKGLGPSKVIDGPDLSFESQAPFAENEEDRNEELVHNDTFGHGTHMGSIAAGADDTDARTYWGHAPYAWNDKDKFHGVAPGARLVNMKVADSQGAVDTTQVIAAIDWVVAHKNDNSLGLNIRVVNLSYGVKARMSANNDALVYAMEQAMKAGIVVVVAGGNEGDSVYANERLLSPSYSTGLLAVGAYDIGTGLSTDFSQMAKERHVDIVAPGTHVMGLHVPGSSTDAEIEADCIDTLQGGQAWSSPVFGDNERFVRGSGTSQAAAMVSGAVALMLSAKPELTPAQVKHLLKSKAKKVDGPKAKKGQGAIDLAAIFGVNPGAKSLTGLSAGGGTLNRSRGVDALPCLSEFSVRQLQGTRVKVNGSWKYVGGSCSELANLNSGDLRKAVEVDVRGVPFDSAKHKLAEEINSSTKTYKRPASGSHKTPWTMTADGEEWNGALWTGASWSYGENGRKAWMPVAWAGDDWLRARFTDHVWTRARFTDGGWTRARFTNGQWVRARFTGSDWVDKSWTRARFTDHSFRDHAWR
jgi:serine protease AprX